jgi:hypothetical protein
MRGAWPRALAIGAGLVVTGVACSSTGLGHGISVSPPPSPTSSLSPATPTEPPSPSPASPLTAGAATVNVSGDFTVTLPLSQLATPAVWGTPPAPMDLRWVGTGTQQLRIAGTSFVSRSATSPELTLTLTVTGPNGAVAFTSKAGECSITITPALPDNMGGVFSCSALTDTDGVNTIDARGVFSATG